MKRTLQFLSYSQMIAFGFFIVIAVGTALLMLPVSTRTGEIPSFTAALLTATSATCVTGLIIYDTYTGWSLFGQTVIISLIQIGGLGFMSVVTLISFALRRRIGLRERGLLKESVNVAQVGGVVHLFSKILIRTLLFEGLGILVLSIRFIPRMGIGEGLYNAFFHAVSAFCNAGFDLMGKYGAYSSLTTFSGDWVVLGTIACLIVIGGIGFYVWDDIALHRHHVKQYALHTKIVLSTTAILIVGGALSFLIFERNGVFASMSWAEKILNALFASITPRTAGFNSVEMTALSGAGKLLTIVLMFIGGSPGSTAGGIKTTTFAVLLISLWATLRNNKNENVFGRRLEENVVKRAAAITVVYLLIMVTAVFIISTTNPALLMENVFFEVTSAIATVGLTINTTGLLDIPGRLVITFLMYCGRVGSLTFMMVFTENRAPSAIQRPIEKINIG